MPELTAKAIVLGMVFGVIFGAATVYLALKAGLTVSASIPISVLAISLFKRFGSSTILENNMVQTIGSAGESIAAGVVFTLPGFLFLSRDMVTGRSVGEPFFSYWTILTLAMLGGVMGVLMMVPLRRSLIVKEHGALPYPEGTACASVLIAGEKGGVLARTAFQGLGFAFAYALLQRIFRFIAETPTLALKQTNRYLPSAVLSGDVTPEYLGIGYIIGPKIAGELVAGGVLAWLALIPLLAFLTPADAVAAQLAKLGYLASVTAAGGPGGWDPVTHTFASTASAIYSAYVRQIGAGAVAAGGFITLLKTLPTIVSSFRESLAALRQGGGAERTKRTDRELPITTVLLGCVGLVAIMAVLPFVPGSGVVSKLLLGLLVIVFGFFFVTVASRIVGLIGTSSNPVSGMTIATLMGTCLIFVGFGWTGDAYQPMALCVGSIVCIAAANAGATSQDLEDRVHRRRHAARAADRPAHRRGDRDHRRRPDHPRARQPAASPDRIRPLPRAAGDADGDADPGPARVQPRLAVRAGRRRARGDHGAVRGEVAVVRGRRLPAALDDVADLRRRRRQGGRGSTRAPAARRQRREKTAEESELGPGNLFATGLVAGGAVAGVAVALLTVKDSWAQAIGKLSLEHALSGVLGDGGYQLLGLICFLIMGVTLLRVARQKPSAPRSRLICAGVGRRWRAGICTTTTVAS